MTDPRRKPMPPDLLAELERRTAEMDCPRCGARALTIRERYDPTRPEPVGVRVAYGPHGRPLWAWCSVCDSHGRVAEVQRGSTWR